MGQPEQAQDSLATSPSANNDDKSSKGEICIRPWKPLAFVRSDHRIPLLGRVGGSNLTLGHWVAPPLVTKPVQKR